MSTSARRWVPPFLAEDNEATQQYLDLFDEYLPDGKSEAILGYNSFSAWLLFATAVKQCGSDVTRSCVFDAASSITEWTGGGLHAPSNPKESGTPRCSVVVEATPDGFVVPDDFEATDPPFACSEDSVLTLEGDYGQGTDLESVGKSMRRPGVGVPPARPDPGGAVEKFLIFTIVGLSLAAIYAVISSGLVLTYTHHRDLQLRPRGHRDAGRLRLLAGPLRLGLAGTVALIVVIGILAPLFGLLLERVIMRGLVGTSEATRLVVSISLLVGLIGLANLVWSRGGADP